MLNRSASLAMSTCVLKALPGKLEIKRHSPRILYFQVLTAMLTTVMQTTAMRGTASSVQMVTIYHHQDQVTVAHVEHIALNAQATILAQNAFVGDMDQNVKLDAEVHAWIV